MHPLKSNKTGVHKRRLLSAALSAVLLFPLAAHVQAEPSLQTPPEMLLYSTVQIPDGAVYEHGDSQITYAAIQGGQVRVTAIGAYGQIKPIASFSKQKLEYISSYHETRDHGFLINDGNVLMKIGPSGKLEWEYASSSAAPSGLLRFAVQLKNNSYVAAVTTPADKANTSTLHLIQLSASGKVVSVQEVPDAVFDNVDTLTPLSDGGFAVSAESVSDNDQEQVYIGKWDSGSNLVWQNRFDPAEDTENLWISSLSEGTRGDLALAGYFNHPNPDGGYRYLTTGYVMNVRQDGSLQWLQKPDASLDRSMINDIQPASDGGYLATGTVNQDWHGTVSKQFVWKLGSNGSTLWNKIINRTTFNSGLLVQPLPNVGQKDSALLLGTADGSPTLIKIGYLKNP